MIHASACFRVYLLLVFNKFTEWKGKELRNCCFAHWLSVQPLFSRVRHSWHRRMQIKHMMYRPIAGAQSIKACGAGLVQVPVNLGPGLEPVSLGRRRCWVGKSNGFLSRLLAGLQLPRTIFTAPPPPPLTVISLLQAAPLPLNTPGQWRMDMQEDTHTQVHKQISTSLRNTSMLILETNHVVTLITVLWNDTGVIFSPMTDFLPF